MNTKEERKKGFSRKGEGGMNGLSKSMKSWEYQKKFQNGEKLKLFRSQGRRQIEVRSQEAFNKFLRNFQIIQKKMESLKVSDTGEKIRIGIQDDNSKGQVLVDRMGVMYGR